MKQHVIAVAQIDAAVGNLEKNIDTHLSALRKAKQGGADLVVFPELSLSGYSVRDLNWHVALRTDEAGTIGRLAAETNDCSVILGSVEESDSYGLYNAALLLENGSVSSVHRKIYPPTYGMFEEMRYFSAGSRVRSFASRIGQIGVLICEDLWHLSLPYLLALDGAEAIICIAASPTRLAGNDERIAIARTNTEQHKALARLLSTYIIFCNRVGFEDGVNFWGGSEVISPDGEIVCQAKLFSEDLLFADLDGNELRRARRMSRHFLDENPSLTLTELSRIVAARHAG
jgi:predicted amidohydrolase